MINTEEMNAALAAVQLCWTDGPSDDGTCAGALRDASHPSASGDARNDTTLRAYARVCNEKGVLAVTLANALRAHVDGDGDSLQAILALPTVVG